MLGAFNKLAFALLLLGTPGCLWSQQDRITAPIDSARIVRPERKSAACHAAPERRRPGKRGLPDSGNDPVSETVGRPAGDLRQLLEDQQNPASPLYHRWLTPKSSPAASASAEAISRRRRIGCGPRDSRWAKWRAAGVGSSSANVGSGGRRVSH